MKDKLMELAVSLGKECGESDKDSRIRVTTVRFFIKKMLAILDAEGDGGAVGDSKALSEVIADMRGRERVGVQKYGVTVDREDLTQAQWGKHLSEELMDALLYLKRIQDCTCPSGDGSLRWPCPAHPARSGVVSDEDVAAAWPVLRQRDVWPEEWNTNDMRAALEHFAKGHNHDH